MKKKWFVIIAFLFIIIFVLIFLYVDKKNSEALLSSNGTITSKYKTVIIDAGHGAEDGGTSSKSGIVEKDVNLAIAKKLESMLKTMGINVLMIRTEDKGIYDEDSKSLRDKKASDLHNRLKIAKETPDSIFVSIHQNHFSSSQYWGAQVFYSPNNEESKALAQYIQASIASKIQPDNKRLIKKSGTSIFVLYYAESPSVMVECGFLSNATEAEKLNDDEYQNEMAFSIMCGIIDFLNSVS